MDKIYCYGLASDGCPKRDLCALYVKPPALHYPCKDYREYWDEEETASGECKAFIAEEGV